jgi:hypothetical protein
MDTTKDNITTSRISHLVSIGNWKSLNRRDDIQSHQLVVFPTLASLSIAIMNTWFTYSTIEFNNVTNALHFQIGSGYELVH